MKTLLKSAFIFAFAAAVTSCNFFGGEPNKQAEEKPTTEITGDTSGEENKVELKKEIDSTGVQPDSLAESKEKKETK